MSAPAPRSSVAERIHEFEHQQLHDAQRVVSKDPCESWQPRLVGGFDCQWLCDRRHVASLVVLSLPTLGLVAQHSVRHEEAEATPYVSGMLGLREVPSCLELLLLLAPDQRPEVLLVDGGGRLHQRRCGSACSIGLACAIPTIGVAKTLLRGIVLLDPTEQTVSGQMATGRLSQLELRDNDGPVAVAVRAAGTRKPVFVSVGSGVSLPTAAALVAACQRHRVPEPIRRADYISRRQALLWQAADRLSD